MSYPLTPSFEDKNGLHPLVSANVLRVLPVDLRGTPFHSPDSSFSGYAADGNYYELGVASAERASWATEGTSVHRGPANSLPERLLVVMTDKEVSLLDASDLALILRTVIAVDVSDGVTDVPAIFLEWVLDESFGDLGNALGVGTIDGVPEGTFRDLAWVNGRLVIATTNGYRVWDFVSDRAYLFRDDGRYEPGVVGQEGLAYRNKADYFGLTPVAFSGLTTALTCAAKRVVDRDFVVVADADEVHVLSWGALTPTAPLVTALDGVAKLRIAADGALVALRLHTPISGDPFLELRYSGSEWRDSEFSGSTQTAKLPLLAGTEGQIAIRGSDVYIGAGPGCWKTSAPNFADAVFAFGQTSLTLLSQSPVADVLTRSGQPVKDVAVDPSTGWLGVLHGSVLDIVDPDQGALISTQSVATTPELPAGPTNLTSFAPPDPEEPS